MASHIILERLAHWAVRRGDCDALQDGQDTLAYAALWAEAEAAAQHMKDLAAGDRVAIHAHAGRDWLLALLATWMRGCIAVPLGRQHPPAEWAYTLQDSGCRAVWCSADLAADMEAMPAADFHALSVLHLPDSSRTDAHKPTEGKNAAPANPLPASDHGALIIYTSGSTGKPKGVLHTHASLAAQAEALTRAWGWSSGDRILNVLPLHHIHGIVNVYACALWTGATIRELHGFDAARVQLAFGQPMGSSADAMPTLFMAVPTVYHRLLAHARSLPVEDRERWQQHCRHFRLMVSGSAALPVDVLAQWKAFSGHTLLERYGMSEIGMALSNPLNGDRVPGLVGKPLPGVAVALLPANAEEQSPPAVMQPIPGLSAEGELLIKGAMLFAGYWKRPAETKAAFTPDGWFRTGDAVAVDEQGRYRIMGRLSVDILKTGGYKVSTLEIEQVLREHPGINDIAVVGVDDADLGQCVCACVVGDSALELEELRSWAGKRLAPYKIPRRLLHLDDLPRNAMGKVLKPAVAALFTAS